MKNRWQFTGFVFNLQSASFSGHKSSNMSRKSSFKNLLMGVMDELLSADYFLSLSFIFRMY